MIDLHMHTLLSDGDLIPAELVQRAKAAGYRTLAITDHVDQSNLEDLVPRLREAAGELSRGSGLTVLAGAEITHVAPSQIADLIRLARNWAPRSWWCTVKRRLNPWRQAPIMRPFSAGPTSWPIRG